MTVRKRAAGVPVRGRINGSPSTSAMLMVSWRARRWPSGISTWRRSTRRGADEPRRLGNGRPGHVVHHGEIGVAAAEPPDRLLSLELLHVHDELGMRTAQIAHRGL